MINDISAFPVCKVILMIRGFLGRSSGKASDLNMMLSMLACRRRGR